MAITTIDDTAFHEAGHSLIAYLIDDFSYFEYVTIDKDLSKMQDGRSIGGVKMKLLKNPDKLSLVEHDKLCIASLAGLAADDINHNNGKISETFYDNSTWAKKMNSNKYKGDYVMLMQHLFFLKKKLNVSQRVYTKSCQVLLFKIFTDEIILKILLNIRNLIYEKGTVTGIEIILFLDNTPLREWKEQNWFTNFINQRNGLYSNNIFKKLIYKIKRHFV